MYAGDYPLESNVDVAFSTVDDTGLPTTLAGSPVVSAYVGNSTTQITAGITLSVDFDSVTGLHNVRVAATAANGYTDQTHVRLVITTGTVDSVSVVGYVVGNFTIGMLTGLTAAAVADAVRTELTAELNNVDQTAADTTALIATIGAAGAGLTEAGGTGDHLTALATAAALATVDTEVGVIDGIVDQILADTGTDGVVLVNDAITAAKIAADAITAAKVAADVHAEAAAAVLTAAAADPIDANVEQVNTVPLVGDGSATPWGPA